MGQMKFKLKFNILRSSLKRLDEIAKNFSSQAYIVGAVCTPQHIFNGYIEYQPDANHTSAMILCYYKQLIAELEKETFVIIERSLTLPDTNYQDFMGVIE